jgi:endonuclease/exonuclease/phosphatase family metal-dependent hydrolase
MTPTEQPRQVTDVLLVIWGITLGSLALLWSIGYAGPKVCVVLLGLSFLGSVLLLGMAILGIRSPRTIVRTANLAIALGTWLAIGIFVYQVLSNEDGPIEIAGPKPYVNENRVPHLKTIRILTLNVLHGFPDFERQGERFKEALAELKRLDADIVVLQEAWIVSGHGSMAERLGEGLGFNYAYARANGSYARIGFEEGSAILSRFPIVEAKRIVLQPRQPWWENRIALIAKLQVPRIGNVHVVGVHLSTSAIADDQAAFLLETLKEDSRVVIAGDFNSLPDSRAIKTVVNRGFVEALPKNASTEPWIDHVFLAPPWHLIVKDASWIITTRPVAGVRDAISDHDGILVELQLP